MAVLPDRRVLHTSRDGRVWLTTPNATTSLAGTIPVYSHDEDGLQGIAIDADFATNRWVYVYYAPPLTTPSGDAPDDGVVVRRLQGPQPALAGQADRRRHARPGDRAADPPGPRRPRHLLPRRRRDRLRRPGQPVPLDRRRHEPVRAGRLHADRRAREPQPGLRRAAQLAPTRTTCAASCCGSRSPPTAPTRCPDGNLFAPGTDKTRPEIYAMGFRNPFRFAIDRSTGWVYLGDYGPDAGGADPNRGPGGQVEFNLIKSAGNYGWPYCHGRNDAYNDYDFATGVSGAKFDCAAPKNTSPAQHRPGRPAAGAPGVDRLRRLQRAPVRLRQRVADGRPRLPLRRRQPVQDEVPGLLRRQELRLRVRPRLDSAR